MTTTAPGVIARLAGRPDATALIHCRRGTSRTVGRGHLVRSCQRTAQALHQAGVRPGHKAVVMTRDAYDLTVVAYALCSLGAVPVLIEPRAEVRRCLRDVAPDVFIGEPLAQLGRQVLGWGRPHVQVSLVTGRPLLAPGRRLVTRAPGGGATAPLPRSPTGTHWPSSPSRPVPPAVPRARNTATPPWRDNSTRSPPCWTPGPTTYSWRGSFRWPCSARSWA